MLKRKFLIGAAVAGLLSMLFVSCGGSSKGVSAKSLPKSNAKKFITCEEDFYKLIDEVSSTIASDSGLVAIAETAMTIDPAKITPNVVRIISEEVERAEKYLDADEPEFTKTGKAGYSIDRKIGDVKGLPAGFSASVPASKANVKLDLKKNGQGTLTGDIDFQSKASLDASKILKSNAAKCFLKGAEFSASVKGTAKADLIADGNFVEDEEDFEDYFYYIDEDDLQFVVDANASTSFGISFCTPSGLGGKLVISAKAVVDGVINSATAEKLENLLDKISYAAYYGEKPSKLDFAVVPADVEISIKFYNDSGKETYSLLDTKSLYDLYEMGYQYYEMFESYIDMLEYYF